MALLTKIAKNLNAFMIVNNITTLISKGPEDTLHSEKDCLSKYSNYTFKMGTIFCNTTFDTYLCWPPTKANTIIQQNCPKVRLSDPSRYAYRQCGFKGLWEGRHPNEASDKGWTNFTPCFPPDLQTFFVEAFNENNVQRHIISFVHITCFAECLPDDNDTISNWSDLRDLKTKFEIAENTRIVEIVGYTFSLIAIVGAIFIFSYFKSLLNKRVIIHRNLFVAMLIQISIHMTLYLDQAFNPVNNTPSQFNNNNGIANTPTLCEALYIFFEISITATFVWMFLEGIYLNFLVSKYALQSNFDLNVYFYIGWGSPCILTAVWAITTWIFYKDEKIKKCWFGYNLAASYWLLQGPRLTIILMNSIILCKVLKAIISKLRAHKTSEIEKIKKSVKAALLLLPLLGVTNLLSTFDISMTSSVSLFRVWFYTRQFFKSFQGLFLSLLYCYFNEEIRNLINRTVQNRRLRYLRRNELSEQNLRRLGPTRQEIQSQLPKTNEEPQIQPKFNPNEPRMSGIRQPPKIPVVHEEIVKPTILVTKTHENENTTDNIELKIIHSNKRTNKNATFAPEETSFMDFQ